MDKIGVLGRIAQLLEMIDSGSKLREVREKAIKLKLCVCGRSFKEVRVGLVVTATKVLIGMVASGVSLRTVEQQAQKLGIPLSGEVDSRVNQRLIKAYKYALGRDNCSTYKNQFELPVGDVIAADLNITKTLERVRNLK